MEKYLRVGVITSPHGVRGEVKVYPTTDDVMRFKKLDKVILDLGRGETRELKIRQVKFFKNMVILKFDGVDTMNEVEGWRQKDLLITRDQAIRWRRMSSLSQTSSDLTLSQTRERHLEL